MSKRSATCLRLSLSWLLAIVLCSQAVLVDAAQASLWSDRRAASTPSSPDFGPLPLPRLSLSARVPATGSSTADRAVAAATAAGSRVSVRTGAPGRVIVLIQDIHANPEAQENARQVASGLIDAGLDVLALEGAFGPLDITRFSSFPDARSLAAAVRYFVADGTLSGAAAAALTSARAPSVHGIDDRGLYDANVAAYLASRSGLESVRGGLANIRSALDAADVAPALRAFDSAVRAYHAGAVPLGRHLETLASAGGDRPGARAFLDALALERSLDFGRVERERRDALQRLGARMSPGSAAGLLRDAAAFRSGRLTAAAFYRRFADEAARAGAPLEKTPAFRRYVDYVLAADRIDAERLFREMADMEEAGYRRLARTPRESAWANRSRRAALAAKLTDLSLSAPEWRRYVALGAAGADAIPGLSPFEDFYRSAERRDAALAANLADVLSSEKADFAAAVAGGFHADAIATRLHRAGWTVVTVTPRVTAADPSRGAAYLSVFAREKTPLEKLFTPERLFVSPDPLLAAPKIPAVTAGIRMNAGLSDDPEPDVRALSGDVPLDEVVADRRDGGIEIRLRSGNLWLTVLCDFHPDGSVASVAERAEADHFIRRLLDGASDRKGTVLYIEDVPPTRIITTRILVAAGYEVVAAADLAQAAEALERQRSAIDVILSDFNLPDGTSDGFYRAVRSDPRNGNVPFIVLSAQPPERLADTFPSEVSILAKPAGIADIDAALNAGLEKRATEERRAFLRTLLGAAIATGAGPLGTLDDFFEDIALDEAFVERIFIQFLRMAMDARPDAEQPEIVNRTLAGLRALSPEQRWNVMIDLTHRWMRRTGVFSEAEIAGQVSDAAARARTADEPPPAPVYRGTVLYIEDDDAFRDTVSGMMADEGYEVLAAATPEEAIALLRERGADIGIVISDFDLKAAMDGGDIYRFAQADASLARIPFAMTSARGPAHLAENGIPPTVPLIPKPNVLKPLRETLGRILPGTPIAPAAAPRPRPAPAPRKVLHVDSRRMSRALLRGLLKRQGIAVDAVATEAEALERLAREPDGYGAIVSEDAFDNPAPGNIPVIVADDVTEAVDETGRAVRVRPLVLYIEDSESQRRSTVNALDRAGFDVVVAENGPEAIGLLEEYGDRLSMILSDFDLPEIDGRPFNGDEIYRRVQESGFSDVPHIFLSARGQRHWRIHPDVPWFTKSGDPAADVRKAAAAAGIAPSGGAPGLAPWFWDEAVAYLRSRGWGDRSIAALGGSEELFFSTALMSGLTWLFVSAVGVDPVASLFFTAVASWGLFTAMHSEGVFAWKDGRLVRAPTEPEYLLQIAGLGLAVRALYLPLAILLPFGPWNVLAASLAAVALHAVYNAVIAPRIGGAAGMAGAVEGDLRRKLRAAMEKTGLGKSVSNLNALSDDALNDLDSAAKVTKAIRIKWKAGQAEALANVVRRHRDEARRRELAAPGSAGFQPAEPGFVPRELSLELDASVGPVAPADAPAKGFLRYMGQDGLDRVAELMERAGLGYALRRHVRYVRRQITDPELAVIARGVNIARTNGDRREGSAAVVIPDYRADVMPEVMGGALNSIYSADLLEWLSSHPPLRQAYERGVSPVTRARIAQRAAGLARAGLPARDDDTLRQVMTWAVLHEIGESFFVFLEAKAALEGNPGARQLVDWWRANIPNGALGASAIKNQVKVALKPDEQYIDWESFADAFALFVHPEGIQPRFGDRLSPEEVNFFERFVAFMQAEELKGEGFSLSIPASARRASGGAGLAPWIWKRAVPYLQARGWSDRSIAGLGGAEELVYSAAATSGLAWLFVATLGMDPLASVLFSAAVSWWLFVSAHLTAVFVFRDGRLARAPPTEANFLQIAGLGLAVRVVYVSLVLLLPFGALNILAALPAAVAVHSFYNAVVAPRFGAAAGMAAGEPDTLLNSRDETFDEAADRLRRELGLRADLPDPRESPPIDGMSVELASMDLGQLGAYFRGLITGPSPAIESMGDMAAAHSDDLALLRAFIDSISVGPEAARELTHHVRSAPARLETLRSRRAFIEGRGGSLKPEQLAEFEAMVDGTLRYQAFMRELVGRWSRPATPAPDVKARASRLVGEGFMAENPLLGPANRIVQLLDAAAIRRAGATGWQTTLSGRKVDAQGKAGAVMKGDFPDERVQPFWSTLTERELREMVSLAELPAEIRAEYELVIEALFAPGDATSAPVSLTLPAFAYNAIAPMLQAMGFIGPGANRSPWINDPDVTMTNATLDDLPALLRLRDAHFSSEVFEVTVLGVDPTPEERLRDALTLGVLRVLRRDGRIIGYAASGVSGPIGYLNEVAVVPDERGRGLGTALLAESALALATRFPRVRRIYVTDGSQSGVTARVAGRLGFQPTNLDRFVLDVEGPRRSAAVARLRSPLAGGTPGLIPWIWDRAIPALRARGWSDRSIAALGGVEDLFFTAALSSGGAWALSALWGVEPVTGLLVSAAASLVAFTAAHLTGAYRWSGGALVRGPPTAASLVSTALFGLAVRAVYVSLILLLPFGPYNLAIAAASAVAAHAALQFIRGTDARDAQELDRNQMNPERRRFLRNVAGLAVQVAGAGPLGRLAQAAGQLPAPSAAAVVADDDINPLDLLYVYLEQNDLSHPVLAAIMTNANLPASVLVAEERVLAALSPARRSAVQELAGLWQSAHARNLSVEAVFAEAHGIVQRMVVQAAEAGRAAMGEPPAAVPAGGGERRPARTFFSVVDDAGMTDAVVAAILTLQIGAAEVDDMEVLRERSVAAMAALDEPRRELALALARIWLDDAGGSQEELAARAEEAIADHVRRQQPMYRAYMAAETEPLPDPDSERGRQMIPMLSEITALSDIHGHNLPLLKSMARAAGVPDEDMALALLDRAAFRARALDAHPYALRAAAERDRFFSLYIMHDGAYHVLRQLSVSNLLPAGTILVNVDPHDDVALGNEEDVSVTAGTWAGRALRDGLIQTYVQARYVEDGVSYHIWSYDAEDERILQSVRSADFVSEMLAGQPVFLTVDADAFNLLDGNIPSFQLTDAQAERRWDEIELLVAGSPVVRVVGVISPDYINGPPDGEWVRDWAARAEAFSRRMAMPAPRRPRIVIAPTDGEITQVTASRAPEHRLYLEATPAVLPPDGSGAWTGVAEQVSENSNLASVSPRDFPLIKAVARRAGIPDERMAAAVTDPAAYRQAILDAHPYGVQAREQLDDFFSVYPLHQGAYHVLRELRNAGRLPARVVLVNVDPHSDLADANDRSAPVTHGSWAAHALRDGLASWYLQARYERDTVTFVAWSLDGNRDLVETLVSPSRLRDLLGGQDVFLTIDADAFSLRHHFGYDFAEYRLDDAGVAARLAEVEELLASSRVVRVVAAISPEYVLDAPDSPWMASWLAAAERTSARLARPGEGGLMAVSILFASAYRRATGVWRWMVGAVAAPPVESALIGLVSGLLPNLVLMPAWVSIPLAAAAGALLMLGIHPRVFYGSDPIARRPTLADRVELAVQGALYGAVYAIIAAGGPGFAAWSSAFITITLVHSIGNALSWARGELMSVGGGWPRVRLGPPAMQRLLRQFRRGQAAAAGHIGGLFSSGKSAVFVTSRAGDAGRSFLADALALARSADAGERPTHLALALNESDALDLNYFIRFGDGDPAFHERLARAFTADGAFGPAELLAWRSALDRLQFAGVRFLLYGRPAARRGASATQAQAARLARHLTEAEGSRTLLFTADARRPFARIALRSAGKGAALTVPAVLAADPALAPRISTLIETTNESWKKDAESALLHNLDAFLERNPVVGTAVLLPGEGPLGDLRFGDAHLNTYGQSFDAVIHRGTPVAERSPLVEAYAASEPLPVTREDDPDGEAIARIFSGLNTLERLRPRPAAMAPVKTAARWAGVEDARIEAALESAALYRETALDVHPYARRAATDADRFFSLHRYHDGAYYVLRQLRREGRLPADAVIVNVDPHTDLYRLSLTDRNVTAASWAIVAMEDGLGAAFLQIRVDGPRLHFRQRSTRPGGEFGLTERISEAQARGMLKGRPVFLTVDADAFSLGGFHSTNPYHLSLAKVRGRLAALEAFLRASGGEVIAVNGAVSPDYLGEAAKGGAWLAGWSSQLRALAARFRPASPLGLSVLFAGLYSAARSAGQRRAIALNLAPAGESVAIGLLALVLPVGLLPFVAGALFVAIHPRVFKGGGDPEPRTPTLEDRIGFFIEGAFYGLLFATLPWLSALAASSVVHAWLNRIAWDRGETLSVGGAGRRPTRALSGDPAVSFALGLAAARDGDAPAAMRALAGILESDGTTLDLESIDGRLAGLEAAAVTARMDDAAPGDRLAAAIRKDFGHDLGESEAFGLLTRWLVLGGAPAAMPAPETGAGSVVMVDDSMLEGIDGTVRNAVATAGEGGKAYFVARTPRLAAAVAAALSRAGAAADVRTRPDLFRATDGALRVSMARVAADLEAALGGRSIGRVVASDRVSLDLDGLSADDPLRSAVFVILSALGPVRLTAGQLDRLGDLARLISRQA